MTNKATWTGKSGIKYNYDYYPIQPFPEFNPLASNYIFSKWTSNGWQAIYIGETGDLSERFQNHHKWNEIMRYGATHIHVHLNNNRASRLLEEADLIAMYGPPANG